MSAKPDAREMTLAEYLTFEAASPERHEYVNGVVYAMSGGTPEHAALVAAVSAALSVALAGKPCRVYSADARLRIEETGTHTYPDLSVVCGKLHTSAGDALAITNPVVVLEVLSPSTEGYDRGAKAKHYRRLASLKEYVLVSQDESRVEVQRLTARGNWELHFFGKGEQVELDSLGIRFSVDALYANPLEG